MRRRRGQGRQIEPLTPPPSYDEATSPDGGYGVDTSFEGPLRRAAGERKGPIAQRWEGEVVMLFAGARHSSGAIFCLLEA